VASGRGTKLDEDAVRQRMAELAPGWSLERGHLVRTYSFPDFKTGLSFVDRVGRLAEAMNHHPVVHLSWGSVQLEVWSHDVDGLSARDFQLARQADDAVDPRRSG
jgi:4a-hydroxytetrahydrobiopterin dehydratase